MLLGHTVVLRRGGVIGFIELWARPLARFVKEMDALVLHIFVIRPTPHQLARRPPAIPAPGPRLAAGPFSQELDLV